ncbi:DUF29 domain-containing protein [Gloeocapsa sp. PCC 73106]|uniref:DUF29 domain-containing protein n=1 Tax=Gloeocapsa sp. PCC 73106 TaxID=102232 RepID=UPI0002AC4D76|nr:DUF29 domain-containing protein [Gloeocapsa sp. PCC 73106]ELR96259.1 protein of unknown function DUF29 [Gloeocapsa sp. PCC 73106]
MLESQESRNLYDQDYYLWLESTAKLLQLQKFHEVELFNLVEEITDMGKNEKRAITSNLRILLMHLLKYQYQPWLFTIVEHRQRIKESLAMSPSLRSYYRQVFAQSYQDARELAAAETGLSVSSFPENPPFTPEDALNSNYLPSGVEFSR